MELSVGTVFTGTVKTITKFGAFVTLPNQQTGLVHISEVSYAYVNDIREHLTEGQEVTVMVIGMENGKVSLSMKRTQPKPQQPERKPAPAAPAPETNSFDDMLKRFMADSDSKISSLRSDHRTKTRKR